MNEQNTSVAQQAAAEQPKEWLAWGLQPDRKALAAWGARAIFFERDGRGKLSVDILWNRQDGIGLPKDQKSLQSWLNKTGLRLLRKAVAQEQLQPNEYRRISVNQGAFRIIADPQQSYGYLYICAMMVPKEG